MKAIRFWLTFGSLISLIEIFIFFIYLGINKTFIFHKEYLLILLPNILYFIIQFADNYSNLTENNN